MSCRDHGDANDAYGHLQYDSLSFEVGRPRSKSIRETWSTSVQR